MSADAIARKAMPDVAGELARGAEDVARVWLRVCEAFRVWERREIILQEPSEAARAQCREALRLLLHFGGRILEAAFADPDLPPSRLFAELEGRLLQLTESWKTLDNPMSAEEADKLLKQIFPEEGDFIERLSRA
jgi:hypothetical protein